MSTVAVFLSADAPPNQGNSSGPASVAKPRGKLRTGVVASNAGLGSKASIPTRFETILNANNHEHNAFGRRTYRFDEPENQLPGPGAYEKNRNIVKQSEVSLSKQGTSGFAKPVGIQGRAARSNIPGPGAYGAETFPTNGDAKGGSASRPSAVFMTAAPKPVLHIARPAADPLGPGHYFKDAVPSTLTAPCAAMTSKGGRSRGQPFNAQGTIGPGAYEVEGYRAVSVKDPLRPSHYSLSGTSRFGPPKAHESATKRTLSTSLPPILASSFDVDRMNVPVVVKDVQETRYRDSLRSAPAPSELSSKPSYMFSDTNLDRFGRPIVRYTAPPSDALGPGSYSLEEKPRRMLISSSWALSGTKRDAAHDRYLPPGPAYYSPPRTAGRVSHRVADATLFVV